MKILRQGVLPSKQIIKTECITCSTVFEFERGEGKTYSDYQSNSVRDGCGVKIKCPVCKQWNWVNN